MLSFKSAKSVQNKKNQFFKNKKKTKESSMGGFSDIIFSYLQFQLYISFIYFKLQPVENDFRGKRQMIGDSRIN